MQIVDEIPLLLMSIYLFRWFDSWPFGHLFLDLNPLREGHRRERPSLVKTLSQIEDACIDTPLVELLTMSCEQQRVSIRHWRSQQHNLVRGRLRCYSVDLVASLSYGPS